MRVSNFGQNKASKMALRLIRGSTYTRVYTVIKIFKFSTFNGKINSTKFCSKKIKFKIKNLINLTNTTLHNF